MSKNCTEGNNKINIVPRESQLIAESAEQGARWWLKNKDKGKNLE